jgi:hypothetical protein
MNQVLHIFKKDARRHWPEILISLTLLALFTRRELHFWLDGNGSLEVKSLIISQVTKIISPILVAFWAFLIVRVVQTDSLVGDRQWWITKPYEWTKLLFAKLLFILVFISIPLVSVQLLLLHYSGFSALHNFVGVLLMQINPLLLLILFSLTLACLTRNLGQALLAAGIVLVAMITASWLTSQFTGDSIQESSKFSQTLQSFLTFGPLLFTPIWQFARRKTWASRGALLFSFAAATLISILPSGNHLEQSYPLVAMKDAPVQFVVPPIPESKGDQGAWPNYSSTIPITIPVNVSGVAPGTMVFLDELDITSDSPQDSRWSRGWSRAYAQIWPEAQHEDLTYAVKHKEYEETKSKPLNLHIQLLLSEYQETDSRTLLVPPGPFQDNYLGICRVHPFSPSTIECFKPFQAPAYIARFDAPNSPCASVSKTFNGAPANRDVAYSWQPPRGEFLPQSGLNPIVERALNFNCISRIPDSNATSRSSYSVAVLCSGAEIRLSRPVLKRQFRIQLDLPNTRLQDLVRSLPVGASGGMAIGF